MIKIGNSISNISFYSCQPRDKKELKDIIQKRILNEGSNCDLNDIDTSLIDDMSYMFEFSKFNGDISKWDVSKVENMYSMFIWSKFNGDISKWEINKSCNIDYMFAACPIKEEYKPKIFQKDI